MELILYIAPDRQLRTPYASAPELTISKDAHLALGGSSEPAPGREQAQADLLITTYSMVSPLNVLRELIWQLLIFDEAQAIKNSGTRQTRAVKQLRAKTRLALRA